MLAGVGQFRTMRCFFPQPGNMGPFFAGFGLAYLFFLLYWAVSGLAKAAMVAGVSRELDGREVGAGPVWRWVFQGRVLGTLFILGFLVGLGLMCCALPGLYLGVVWSLAIPIVAAGEVTGYPALARSRMLILHSNEKRIFPPGLGWAIVVFLTAIVLSYGVSMAVQFPMTILSEIFMVRNVLGETARQTNVGANPFAIFPPWFLAVQVVTTVVSGLARALVALYSAAAFTLLFRRLRGRREGTDLVEALDRLGAPR
jgi:hypothetical protein